MSWYETLQKDFDPEGVITGRLWRNSSGEFLFFYGNYWCIANQIGFPLLLDSSPMQTFFYNYNGKRYYKGGGKYLWYSPGDGWVISPKLGYVGSNDISWKNSTKTGTYTSEDTGAADIEITEGITGYQRTESGYDKMIGEYEEIGGGGTRYVGLPQYEGKAEPAGSPTWLFNRTVSKDYNNEYRYVPIDGFPYGNIYYDGSGWVIGIRDSEQGWWESPIEPDIVTPTVFLRQKTATGSYPADYDVAIDFKEYVLGDNKKEIMFADVGRFY